MHPQLRKFFSVPPLRLFWWTLLRTLALAYVGLALFAAGCVNTMLFHPPPLRNPVPGQIKLPAADGNKITAVFLPNPKAAYVILYSYGNGESLEHCHEFLDELREHGWSVCAYDYPGYGTSTGKPTEAGCYAAINAVYDYLVKQRQIPPERIVLYGQSMGSGPTVDLASRQPIGGLILHSAFLSVFRVVTHYHILPWDVFNNLGKIDRVKVPLLSIHGRADTIVPFWQGQALYNAYPGPKTCLWIPNAGHNDILEAAPEEYWAALERYRAGLPLKTPLNL